MQIHLQLKKAHLFDLKRLNVSPKTPNDMVYGETEKTPLHLYAKVSSIRFWLRLKRVEVERLRRMLKRMPTHPRTHTDTDACAHACRLAPSAVSVWTRRGNTYNAHDCL